MSPPNRALFDVEGDGADALYVGSFGQLLHFGLRAPTGVSSWVLQVWNPDGFAYGTPILDNAPRASKSAPLLTLVGDASGQSVSVQPRAQITTTLPGVGTSSWIVRSVVDGGMSGNPPRPDPSLVHERIVMLSSSNLRKPPVTETTQADADSWAGVICDIIDALNGGVPTTIRGLTNFIWVDSLYVGISNGSISAPYSTVQQAVTAAGPNPTVVILAPGTYSETAISVPKNRKLAICALANNGLGVASITNQIAWTFQNGDELHLFGVNAPGGIALKDGDAGTGAVLLRAHSLSLGDVVNGNASAAPFTHVVGMTISGEAGLSPTSLTAGHDCVVGALTINGVLSADSAFIGGGVTCSLMNLRRVSSATGLTFNTSSSGSSFRDVALGTSCVLHCTAGSAGQVSIDETTLFYLAANGVTQTGTVNALIATDIDHTAELVTGSIATGAGAAAALDLVFNTRQKVLLSAATCAISVASGRQPLTSSRIIYLRITQDATGGRLATFSSDFVGTRPTLNSAANAETIVPLYWNGSQLYFFSGVSGSVVLSWNGRINAVVPVAGDYAASQVTNDSAVTGAHVSDALNALKIGTPAFSRTVLYVDPTFTGTPSGTEANPYPSHRAAIAAAPAAGALLEQAPLTTSVENITIPTTGQWEISCRHEVAPHITGNIVCSGSSGGLTLNNVTVSGTVTGANSGVRYLAVINTDIPGSVSLTGGNWLLFADAPGASSLAGTNGFFGSSVAVAGVMLCSGYLFQGAISCRATSKFIGCEINASAISATGSLLLQDCVFAVAPTFTGAAVVTFDGFSHASALAAGGITLAGGATLALWNDVMPAGIQQSGATLAQAIIWTGSQFAPGTLAASNINNDSAVTGTTAKDALNTLKAAIAAVATSAGVSSFNLRVGAVSSAVADYLASQITNDSATVTGTRVSNALDSLKASIGALVASAIGNDSSVTGATVKDALNQLKATIAALVFVATFNSRSGFVSPATNDYAASQVSNDSASVPGAHVSNALDSLNGTVAGLVTGVSSVFGRVNAIIQVAGDYAASKISNDSGVAGAFVKNALDTLGGLISSLDSTQVFDSSTWGGPTVRASLESIATRVLFGFSTNDVHNASGVSGTTTTDALNALNGGVSTIRDFIFEGSVTQVMSVMDHDSGWQFFGAEGWEGDGTGANIFFSLGPHPVGATITQIVVSWKPKLVHSHLPNNLPSMVLYTANPGAPATARSAVDPTTVVSVYNAFHSFGITGLSIASGTPMWLLLTDESGVNALPGMQPYEIALTYA